MSKKRFLKAILLFIMVLSIQVVHAQVKTVTGTIKDDKGQPVPSATVKAVGSTEETITDADGKFSLSVPATVTSVVVSSVGFGQKTVSVDNVSNITLKHSAQELDTVVVQTGVGTTRRLRDVTGAISHVSGAAIKNLPTQDVATALQGRVAGVDVVSASGQPGSSSQITIRGVASLNNANPLYIIDGVQQTNGSGTTGNNINPNDIESIDVLKDASAAAIYGAAAAGGVIIITTKRGKGTKPTISFDTRYGVTTPRLVQLLDKDDFVKYQKDIKNSDYTNPANAVYIDSLTPIDWNKELYRNGNEQNYNLSISGATANINYFLSGVYNNQKGVFLDNGSTFAGARMNTDIKLSNRVKVGEQLNVWQRSTAPVKTAVVSTPFLSEPVFTGGPVFAPSGQTYGVYPFSYHGFNPVAQIKSASFDFPETNFQGQVYFEYKPPIKYVTFKATFGYTDQTYQNNLFQQNLQTNGQPKINSDGSYSNSLYRNIGSYKQSLNAFILAYDHTWGKHTLNLLAGYEQYASKIENMIGEVPNVLGSTYGFINSSSSLNNQVVTGNYDTYGLVQSVFGRINYDFDKKYYATITVRQDANYTAFGPGKQSGVFPAVSAGWNIDKEKFFTKLSSLFSQLKLRASYGELGNSGFTNYAFANLYNQGLSQNFSPGGSAQVSYITSALANKNIQWESTHETNIGIDGQMLDGKIYFTVDWYNKNTTALLYNVPIALSSGLPPTGDPVQGLIAPTYFENIGSVRNRGLELALGYTNSATVANSALHYSVGFTGSFNQNKVTSLGNGGLPLYDGNNDYPYSGGNSIWNSAPLTKTEVGLPFGQFYGLKSDGVIGSASQLAKAQVAQPNAKLGDLMYEDLNHDGIIDTKDQTTIGNPYPKFTYGINISASWKNFDVSMLFNGAAGVQLYNGVLPYELESENNSNVTSKVFAASEFTHDGITNGITKYPRIGSVNGLGSWIPDNNGGNGNYSQPSSYFVENGSYLKLKNLQIGYSFSNKLLQRVKIKTLRIYVMTNNLFTITKYSGVDPELGSQYSSLNLTPTGSVEGSADGTATANHGGVTNRGIDGPGKYPNVRLYAAGLDITF
ncbi:MAG TPA: SusC/RagA family TonB-linked outer membrane protein [Ferruginibacter sp.]|nr:SusC/RagA family TonB-linked outer membrane protein [Ferruginibacter sp.]